MTGIELMSWVHLNVKYYSPCIYISMLSFLALLEHKCQGLADLVFVFVWFFCLSSRERGGSGPHWWQTHRLHIIIRDLI